jgi:hypothetical protein
MSHFPQRLRLRPGRRAGIGIFILLLAGLSALACSIPVFRYALDRWPADNFRIEVSAADSKDETIARFIRNFGAASALNMEVARVEQGPSRLLAPHADEKQIAPLWSGALNSAVLATLTNSPARVELVRRALAGDSAVWVLVESGNRTDDDAMAKTIEKRLRYLEQVAQLPLIDPNDPSSKLGPGPRLAVKFSLLRVSAKAAEEVPFLSMLAGPKSVLAGSSEPWVAAVFGRGRVLGAWPAKGFGDEQIEEVCLFLLGACSCQVKNLNPGWDLLLRVDWDEELRATGYQGTPEQTFRSDTPPPAGGAPETVTISGGEDAPRSSIRREEAVALGGAALLLVVAGGFAWRKFIR